MGIFSFGKKASQKITINDDSDLVKALGLEDRARRLVIGKFAVFPFNINLDIAFCTKTFYATCSPFIRKCRKK